MTTIIFLVIIMYIVLFTFGFLSYLFNSIGLYNIAKSEGEGPYLLAWIPYLNKYLLGKIAFKSNIQALILVTLNVAIFIISLITLFISSSNIYTIYILAIIGFAISIITSIYNFVAHYKIYSVYSKSTIIMMCFDIISFGLLGPIFIFAIRNNKKNYEK